MASGCSVTQSLVTRMQNFWENHKTTSSGSSEYVDVTVALSTQRIHVTNCATCMYVYLVAAIVMDIHTCYCMAKNVFL